MKFYICVLSLCFLFILGCKHKPEIIETNYEVLVGDSTLMPTENGIELMPNLGKLKFNYYIAPQSIGLSQTEVLVLDLNKKNIAKIKIFRRDINDTLIRFNETVFPLLVSNCNFTACHGNGSSAGGVSLISHQQILNTLIPFQPEKSSLYLSLVKSNALRRMPPAGPLHAYKIIQVKNWIEQGALNN